MLILGHRYGTQALDGVGYTEKEYDYAREKGIPVLAFIRNRDVATQAFERESAAAVQKKLDRFVEKAKSNKLVRFWNTTEDLATQVSTSLTNSIFTNPQVGWVRGDKAASPELAEELMVLSRENRELKAALDVYKKMDVRLPSIKVILNDCDEIKLNYLSSLPNYHPLEIPKEITMSDVPPHLVQYVTEDALEKYNKNISENEKKVAKYNKDLKMYKQIESMGFEFDIALTNVGASKANSIYVDIEFPDAVTVYDGTVEDFPLPAQPSLTTSPLKKAEAAYRKAMDPQKLPLSVLGMNGLSSLNLKRIDDYNNLNI